MLNNFTPRTASMYAQQKKKSSFMSKFKTFIGKTPKNADKKNKAQDDADYQKERA